MNDSKQAITASGASAVTDTMSSATTSLTGAMQGGVGKLFHKKAASATDPSAPAQSGATSQNDLAAANPASNVIPSANDSSPGSATIAATAPAPADSGSVSFVFCHLQAAGATYVSDIFPSTDASDAGAQTAFWRQVGRQYKLTSIPFRDNVACVRSADEPQSITARKSLLSTNISASKAVDTGWTYMGDAAAK